MRTRSTVTAAFALAAATILAVAACGSSVNGSAQANSAAVADDPERAWTAPSTAIPSELSEQTADRPRDLAELTLHAGRAHRPDVLSVPSRADRPEPASVTCPASASPATTATASRVASAYASVTFALLPVLFGGLGGSSTPANCRRRWTRCPAAFLPELAGDIAGADRPRRAGQRKVARPRPSEILDSEQWTTAVRQHRRLDHRQLRRLTPRKESRADLGVGAGF